MQPAQGNVVRVPWHRKDAVASRPGQLARNQGARDSSLGLRLVDSSAAFSTEVPVAFSGAFGNGGFSVGPDQVHIQTRTLFLSLSHTYLSPKKTRSPPMRMRMHTHKQGRCRCRMDAHTGYRWRDQHKHHLHQGTAAHIYTRAQPLSNGRALRALMARPTPAQLKAGTWPLRT